MSYLPDWNPSRALKVAFIIGLILFIIGCCVGCTPSFAQKYIECGLVSGQKLQKNKDNPEVVETLGKALETNGEKVLLKTGRCGELINEENVEKKLEESGREADAYQPWYSGLENLSYAGIPIGLMLMYLLRGPLRGLLHSLTHNPKGGNDEVAKS